MIGSHRGMLKFASHGVGLVGPKALIVVFTLFVTLLHNAFSAETGEAALLINATFKSAYARADGKVLTIGTGKMQRRWRMTEKGLVTIGLLDSNSEKQWVTNEPGMRCDWDIGGMDTAVLTGIEAVIDDDDGFANKHLKITSTFQYDHISVTHTVWAYPDAPGLRTQIAIAGGNGRRENSKRFERDRTDSLCFASPFDRITAFGYRQGQKTNMRNPILREESLPWRNQTIEWPNGLVLQGADGGVVLIKESHKHIQLSKQTDDLTGVYTVNKNRLVMTGIGYTPDKLSATPMACWANWVIVYTGETEDAQLALKRFDRIRYPVHPKRGVFMMANTWGSEDKRDECLYAAREENVLRELDSAADLGIDVVQIDDGWQKNDWTPAARAEQVQRKGGIVKKFGNYPVYPDGFAKVRAKADELKVQLGLWAAWWIPLDKLKMNYADGDFKYFKLDFADLKDKLQVDALLDKARELIKHSGYTARVNWDVTEIPPRFGYYYGREVGTIYLANRKTLTARAVVQYIPSEILRNGWMIAKYGNLNQFQMTIGNIDRRDKNTTYAPNITAYDHPYLAGIALMSSPIFFQETRYYSDAARAKLRPVLATYRRHRRKMYEGYVFPIGDVPNDKSWTGFQNHLVGQNEGFLTLFREMANESSSQRIRLHFIAGTKLHLEDLMSGAKQTLDVDEKGGVTFRIPKKADWRFYRYRVRASVTNSMKTGKTKEKTLNRTLNRHTSSNTLTRLSCNE